MISNPIPHRIIKKLGNGKYQIAHDDRCQGICNILHSVKHAPWVTYDQIAGIISCDHCGAKADLPCPAVKTSIWSKEVYLRLEALESDLWYFQLRHESCPAPKAPHTPDDKKSDPANSTSKPD